MGLMIGKIELKNPYILAPMAGVTDLPFRLLCSGMGSGLVCMEMISAKAISFKNKKTYELMRTEPEERPVALQLFGSEPELMAEVVQAIEEEPFDILDINMGCPMPKIVNNGEGSALMKDPALVSKIVSAVSNATRKPVTVKIRKGFDAEHVNAVEIAKSAEAAGAAAITVHGRTREQYYEGKADWDIIAEVKRSVSIPVIGNGDVVSTESAKAMMDQTGCDAVAVARAARGNPWIFRELILGKHSEPTMDERKDMIQKHCSLQVKYKGEYIAVREMRKHISWYTAGLPNSAKLRVKVNQAEKMEDLLKMVNEL